MVGVQGFAPGLRNLGALKWRMKLSPSRAAATLRPCGAFKSSSQPCQWLYLHPASSVQWKNEGNYMERGKNSPSSPIVGVNMLPGSHVRRRQWLAYCLWWKLGEWGETLGELVLIASGKLSDDTDTDTNTEQESNGSDWKGGAMW